MSLKDLIAHIHERLDLILGSKQSGQIDIQINISQGGIGKSYIQYKSELLGHRNQIPSGVTPLSGENWLTKE